MEHFDPAQPELHDAAVAEYFFTQAVRLDPSYSLAYQQLARLHFLRSDFSGALTEINEAIHLQGDEYPSAFYIRGLIEGFTGDYANAANDYQHFLRLQPKSWAGSNDYAWVLMKAYRYSDAVKALETGLANYPDNAWLLNSYAIALYESGHKDAAKDVALRAKTAVQKLTPTDWSFANPGNDPAIASEGIQTFKTATLANLDIIIAGNQSTLQ
jgi:tetratricopeptide (TPR) repeat protein